MRKTSFRGGKSINYLLKRNTKAFFKNRYNIFDVHKKNEDAKVYNINCDDDVIRYENGDIYKLLDEAIYCIMTVSECSNKL